MRLSIVITILLVSISSLLLAQPPRSFSVDDKKAINAYTEAEQHYRLRLFNEAETLIDRALDRAPNFVECYLLRAQIQTDLNNDEAARQALTKAVDINAAFFPPSLFYLAALEQRMENYEKAREYYLRFARASSDEEPLKAKAQLGIESCDFAVQAKANPVPFKPVNLGPEINSDRPEYFPCMTADGETILYTRLVEDRRSLQGKQEDFYIAQKKDGKWLPSLPLTEVNTVQNEGAPTLSLDGQVLIFTACENIDGWGSYSGLGSCDLFFTQRSGDFWDTPRNMGKVNSYKWDSQPSFSADGRTLFFVRGVSGAKGISSQDIYTSHIGEDGTWTKPEKIKGSVNTPYEEESVLIHPDGQSLYFASNGHPGMGGMDLFVSRKLSDGTWGTPENLGYPINTGGSENSILVAANGSLAMFASDREGGYGDLDLYSFELPEARRAGMVSYVKGEVFDAVSFRKLQANFELIDLANGEVVVSSYSNEGDGSFLVCLPPNRNYALNVSRQGYLFYSDHFSLGESTSTPFELEVPLKKIREGSSVVLNNVFFDTDSYTLRDESKIELEKLVQFLQSNSQVSIEIGGHTDDVGSGSDNQVLSERRAAAVVDYLVSRGIAQERLSSVGYGETAPLVSNDSQENRAKNRRTEFKIR
ncbi:MAG: OmpA family protein [Flavobacteriales bacterium]|nr:OmpA family protein [Flavobacteriales bacterium]MDG1765859.1 OmpA family protein [Flavobacteriales bacterium]